MRRTSISLANQHSAQLEGKDYLSLLLLILALFTTAILQSRTGPLWSDEIFGFLVLHQPTLAQTLLLWRNGVDSSGFWFEIVGRLWLQTFGTSALALRLYSATAVAGAAVALWAAARRLYSFPVVAASVVFLFANSLVLRWQLVNGRTYGLLLLAVALVFYFVIRGDEQAHQQPSFAFLSGVFAANVLLAGSHILGPVYVVICFAAQFALDLYRQRFRPKLYLAVLCSEAMLFVDWPNIKATVAVGKPSFWTVPPHYRDFLRLKWIFDVRISLTIVSILFLVLIARRFHLDRRHASTYALTASFACFAVFLFAYSRVGTSIYVDRYMIPFSLIGGLVLCEVLAMLVDSPWSLQGVRLVVPLSLVAISVIAFFVPRFQRSTLPSPDVWPTLAANLPPGIAIASPEIGVFVSVEFFHHNPNGRQIVFPTDWAVALDPDTKGGVSGYHEIDNLKRLGIFDEDIEPTSEFLRSHQEFAVISGEPNVWLRRRILSNPRYQVQKYSTYPAKFEGHPVDVYLVRSVSPMPSSATHNQDVSGLESTRGR